MKTTYTISFLPQKNRLVVSKVSSTRDYSNVGWMRAETVIKSIKS